jgi:hypothetical protein
MVQALKNLVKTKFLINVLIVLFANAMYFSSDYLPDRTDTYLELRKKYKAYETSEQNSLKDVLKASEGTLLYKKYVAQKEIKEKSEAVFYKYTDSIKFFSFNDFWQFLYEFGKSFPFLILLLILQFWFLTRQKRNIGMIFLTTSFLCLSIFKMYWIFQPFLDVSKASYYLISLITSVTLILSVSFLSKSKITLVQKLKSKNDKLEEIREKLMIHTILHSNPEKKKEILDYIESTY